MEWEGKEVLAVAIMEAMGDAVIAHDDKLLLRGVKTRKTAGKAGGVGLEEEWWREVPKAVDENGRDLVIGYWNEKTGEHHGAAWAEAGEKMATEPGWKETFLRRRKLAEGVWLNIKGNQVDLTMANLNNDLRSRYRMALEHAVDMAENGILGYRPRAERKDKNRTEAIRNRMKREFKPTEYEHEIIVRGEVGRGMMEALKKVAEGKPRMKIEPGTVYLAGYKRNSKTRVSVKYYDIGARDIERGGKPGEVFKLETTLHREYFKAAGLNVSDMLEQPDIQEMLSKELEQRIESVLTLIQEQGDGVMTGLQRELGLDALAPPREIARAMLRKDRTLSERVSILERDMAETKRRVAALEAEGRGINNRN